MNKSDIKLIVLLLFVSLVFIFLFKGFFSHGGHALVYYRGNLILTIDLSIDNDYTVLGDNGNVLIKVSDGKIRVVDENSPLHLCSRQGYISKGYESIVCLPNKIVITIDDSDIDAVVK